MTTAVPSTALSTVRPALTHAGRAALAGFLAGYRGLTREACTLDLRQFTSWCRVRSAVPVRRPPRRHRKLRPRAGGDGPRPGRRHPGLSAIAGSCRYAVEDELLDRSPAAHVGRPRVDYASRAVVLDRSELGALLVASGPGPPAGHALISLLALNGLRYRRPPALTSSTWGSSAATGP
jgi:integrase/recombinase XerD